MLISEAILHLQHVGVERIDRIANPYGTQTWRVTQNGEEYIYTADLERVVWALTPSDDWGGVTVEGVAHAAPESAPMGTKIKHTKRTETK